MRVHILHDYDYDCEVFPEGTPGIYSTSIDNKVVGTTHPKVYEVPDELIKEYEAVNKRREEIKDQLKLIIRRGPL